MAVDQGRPLSAPWHGEVRPDPVAGRRAAQEMPPGLVTRSLANVADVVVVIAMVAAGWLAVAAARFLVHPTRFTFPDPGARTLLLVGLGVQALYFTVTWAVIGGTYGDRLLALRVVGRDGRPLHWGRCALRAVFCTVFPIGLLWVLVSSRNHSVQDAVLRTSVLRDG